MADQFSFTGSYDTKPLSGSLSFAALIDAPINEAVNLEHKSQDEITIIADAPVVVAFGGVTNAHIVIMKATGKVVARFTSANGSAQSIPFDTYLIIMSESAPFTAIDLTRVAGVETTVSIFLGEKA